MWMYSPKLWIVVAVILFLLLGWDALGANLQDLIGGRTDTTATITQCDMNDTRRDTNLRTSLTYRYTVNGMNYTARSQVGGHVCDSQYKVGDTLQITYQNSNAGNTQIKGVDVPLMIFPCIIVSVGISILVALYLMRERRPITQD